MTKKKKHLSTSQRIARGVVAFEAYKELMPIVTKAMVSRDMDDHQASALMSMIVTTLYSGDKLDRFIDCLLEAAEFRQKWREVMINDRP